MAVSLTAGVKETGSRRLWRPLFLFMLIKREGRVWHKADVINALTDVRFRG
jgi:hypothetical protein